MDELKMPYGVPMRPTMTHTIVFSLLLLLLSICPAWGRTFYVKTGGNDSAAGTSDGTAWATVSKVQSTVTSGDTVYFRSQDTWTNPSAALVLNAIGGVTYIGNGYGSGTRATILAGSTVGSNNQVVMVPYSNVVIRGFNIDMNGLSVGGVYIKSHYGGNINNVTLDNLVIHDSVWTSGFWGYGINAADTAGYAVTNVTITNINMYNIAAEGIAAYAGWQVAGNRLDILYVSGCTVDNAGVGLLLANDINHATVENNIFRNGRTGGISDGIYIRISAIEEEFVNVPNGPRNLIIRNNYIHHVTRGIHIANGKSLPFTGTFYNNLFYENGGGSGAQQGDIYMRVGFTNPSNTPWYYPAGTNLSFYNNTFYTNVNLGTTSNTVFGLCAEGAADHCGSPTVNFKNNIIHVGPAITSNGFKPIWDKAGTMTAAGTHSNNLIYRVSGTTAVVNNATTYTMSNISTWEPTVVKNNPLFASTAMPDLHLQSGSPAINAGVNVGLTTDYLGNAIAGLPDIGAYEFQPSKKPTTPTGFIIP